MQAGQLQQDAMRDQDKCPIRQQPSAQDDGENNQQVGDVVMDQTGVQVVRCGGVAEVRFLSHDGSSLVVVWLLPPLCHDQRGQDNKTSSRQAGGSDGHHQAGDASRVPPRGLAFRGIADRVPRPAMAFQNQVDELVDGG